MSDRTEQPLYRCGTLTYTRLGLITLFAYLLWGDFCYAMVNLMVPTLLPMVLCAITPPSPRRLTPTACWWRPLPTCWLWPC